MGHADTVNTSYQAPPKYDEVMPGVPERYQDIRTLGDLLSINYKVVSVREQLRRNLMNHIKTGEDRYPGIIGYEQDVTPALDRAILAGHDIILVGQMGQAKTRIAETMARHLLSPMPIVMGSLTNDTPMDMPKEYLIALLDDEQYVSHIPTFHTSPETEKSIRDNRLDTPIRWIDGYSRSRFVVGTPDITSRDLVGYVDAVKITQRGVEMYDIESYTPGQLMQSKHGIFCMDELPVLDPRKQVTLLSVLQEGRFTTGAYPVIFRPRCALVATANPVDYTHSGRIIEPLYDRLRSHIHTRHPDTIDDEMVIILQESNLHGCHITEDVLLLLAKTVRTIRKSPLINRDKGVSVRMGIHGLELLVSEAQRVRPHEIPCPRPSDFDCLSQVARFELLEIENTLQNRKRVLQEASFEAIKNSHTDLEPPKHGDIKAEFAEKSFVVSQKISWQTGTDSYSKQLESFPHLTDMIRDVVKDMKSWSRNTQSVTHTDGINAVATEMVLERLCWTEPQVLERRDKHYVAI